MLTLDIRNKELRQKFYRGELEAVKYRWEVCTVIYAILTIISALFNWGDMDALLVLVCQIGDNLVVLLLFSMLGRTWITAHHFSLIAMILTRCCWSYAQIYMVTNDIEPMAKYFDYFSWSQAMVQRVMVPASMLFMTKFKYYLYVILPLSFVMQYILISQAKQVYESHGGCDVITDNIDSGNYMMRDFMLVLFLSMGFYSHYSTLANRFLTYEKSEIQ